MVVGLLIKGEQVVGVKTSLGLEIKSRSVVLTNGTFLNGLIHIGDKNFGGGRAGERAAIGITVRSIKRWRSTNDFHEKSSKSIRRTIRTVNQKRGQYTGL